MGSHETSQVDVDIATKANDTYAGGPRLAALLAFSDFTRVSEYSPSRSLIREMTYGTHRAAEAHSKIPSSPRTPSRKLDFTSTAVTARH